MPATLGVVAAVPKEQLVPQAHSVALVALDREARARPAYQAPLGQLGP